MNMSMTHYMELLATNQPWNLLIFMAIPIVLAETLAITELYILLTKKYKGVVWKINHWSGKLVGAYFIGIIYYIMVNAVIPLTLSGEWRGVVDIIAVLSYVIAGLPLVWIFLQSVGLVNRKLKMEKKLAIHATCVALFLVFGHVAMIFGMIDPTVFGHAGHQM